MKGRPSPPGLVSRGRIGEAIAAYRADLAASPDDAALLTGLAELLLNTGRAPEAVTLLRRALFVHGWDRDTHGQLLFALNHVEAPAEEIAREHAEWGGRVRPLRIGYVSDAFRRQSVACFLLPFLAAHDRRRHEIFAYDTGEGSDDIHKLSRSLVGPARFRSAAALTDRQLSSRIRRDGIDALVDLSGHTARERLDVFAQRAAPVQITYLGYPDTTGLANMDYRITDGLADPPGLTEHLHTERLLRLDRCFLAYRPPTRDVPATRAEDGSRPFTFACFNRPAKWNDACFATWAAILRRVPGSRLLLHHQVMRPFPDEAAEFLAAEARARLAAFGVEPARIDFIGRRDVTAHFELYRRVDLCLDPFPYAGTTSTCEALWMGVPVIALAGGTHVSRVGVSLLNAVGMPELVCESREAYVAAAVKWARRRAKLAAMRTVVRQAMSESELMDGEGLARALESAFRLVTRSAPERRHP